MAAAALRQPPPRPVVAQRQLAAPCPTGPFSQARPAHAPPLQHCAHAGSLLCRGRQGGPQNARLHLIQPPPHANGGHLQLRRLRHPLLPYGDLSRQLRRICLLELMSARRVLSFRHIREDEVTNMIHYITDKCARGGGSIVVEIGKHISRTVNDIVVRSAVGGRCPWRDEFLHELDRSVKLAGGFILADLYPSLSLAQWLRLVVMVVSCMSTKQF
ncbi:Cytochrome P450 71D7 [Hordeum vulgare]|nr:Cytochrome P450 71D7 [Hordeum vulgare]